MKKDFILGMRRVTYPVCIASSYLKNSKFAITLSSVTSISIDPPALLACINKASSMASSIKLESLININFLSSSQHEIASACSNKDRVNERFTFDQWCSDENEVPYLDESEMVAFSRVTKIIEHSTHLVIILDVLCTRLSMESESKPLLYKNGKYLID